MKLVALFLTIVPLNPGGPVEAGPPERSMAVKKETGAKITAWLCWSILTAGMGYAWCYHHWMAWAAAKSLTLYPIGGN